MWQAQLGQEPMPKSPLKGVLVSLGIPAHLASAPIYHSISTQSDPKYRYFNPYVLAISSAYGNINTHKQCI